MKAEPGCLFAWVALLNSLDIKLYPPTKALTFPLKGSITTIAPLTFGSCLISNVSNRQSPEWLREKISALGLKPISAIVDITNYVMFDLNRPLHAYDADKIEGGLIVRNSKANETFEALDDKNYKLDKDMCVISDKKGILGLGGIIGGVKSGTEFSTTNILLEAAYFLPSSVRKTAKKLNLETDAKYRFERGIDPNSVAEGLHIATNLILEISFRKSPIISFQHLQLKIG